MRGEPNVAAIAALIADPGRAAMLAALADGRALPAGELAAIAGLSAQGASAHIAKLTESGLLTMEREGRHRYYRLASAKVAAALEGLALLVDPVRPPRFTRSPEAEALRRARSCYDHLAGELGVKIAAALEKRGFVAASVGKSLKVTRKGVDWFEAALGIDVSALRPGRNGVACRCLDWTERRYHLAGPLGSQLLSGMLERRWLQQLPDTRALKLTPSGHRGLRYKLGIPDWRA
jgi:DNA-binding transcriptional ArsR family regulator